MTIRSRRSRLLPSGVVPSQWQLRSSATRILPILKFKSGDWVLGSDNTPVTEGQFVADVLGAQFGYVCFVNGSPVDEVLVPVAVGTTVDPDDPSRSRPVLGD